MPHFESRGARRGPRAALLALALLAGAPLLGGGTWHQYQSLVCSDCHTMHNSAGGKAMRYDGDTAGAERLLRSATADALCLHCHGTTPVSGAPGVAQVQGSAPPYDSAGGFFSYSSQGGQPVPGFGHTVGVPPAEPNAAAYFASSAMTLRCISCHDQHGSTLYRNLRPDPPGRGNPVSPLVTERVLAGQGSRETVYSASNVRYQTGFTGWCQTCHDQYSHYHVDVTFEAQPALAAIWAGTQTSAAGTPLPRLRVQTPLVETVPDPANQVFCLSCHKAHGNAAPHGVIYPDPSDANSLCAQCHVPPSPPAP